MTLGKAYTGPSIQHTRLGRQKNCYLKQLECLNTCLKKIEKNGQFSIFGAGLDVKIDVFGYVLPISTENARKTTQILNQSWCHQILGYSTQKDHFEIIGPLWPIDSPPPIGLTKLIVFLYSLI